MIGGINYLVDDQGASSLNPLVFEEAASQGLVIDIPDTASTTSQSSVFYRFNLTLKTNVIALDSCAWVYPPTSCLSLNPSGTNVTKYSNCTAFNGIDYTAGQTVSF